MPKKIDVKFAVNNHEYSEAIIYHGIPQRDIPASYKPVGICCHNMGNNYNASTMEIFMVNNRSYRYGIYRDGCFHRYFGRIEFI